MGTTIEQAPFGTLAAWHPPADLTRESTVRSVLPGNIKGVLSALQSFFPESRPGDVTLAQVAGTKFGEFSKCLTPDLFVRLAFCMHVAGCEPRGLRLLRIRAGRQSVSLHLLIDPGSAIAERLHSAGVVLAPEEYGPVDKEFFRSALPVTSGRYGDPGAPERQLSRLLASAGEFAKAHELTMGLPEDHRAARRTLRTLDAAPGEDEAGRRARCSSTVLSAGHSFLRGDEELELAYEMFLCERPRRTVLDPVWVQAVGAAETMRRYAKVERGDWLAFLAGDSPPGMFDGEQLRAVVDVSKYLDRARTVLSAREVTGGFEVTPAVEIALGISR